MGDDVVNHQLWVSNPRVRIIYPLFTPISLAEAYLAQPKVPELLCHLGLSGRVVGERFSEVDRSLELPNVSCDEDYWFVNGVWPTPFSEP